MRANGRMRDSIDAISQLKIVSPDRFNAFQKHFLSLYERIAYDWSINPRGHVGLCILIKGTESLERILKYLIHFAHLYFLSSEPDDADRVDDIEDEDDEDMDNSGVLPDFRKDEIKDSPLAAAREQCVDFVNRLSVADLAEWIGICFTSEEPVIRSSAVTLFWSFLNMKWKKEHICSTPWTCHTCSGFVQSFSDFITKNYKGLPITEEVLDVVYSLLVDGFWDQGYKTSVISATTCHPELWKVYLHFVSAAELRVKRKALMDANSVLINQDENAQCLTDQENWMDWLFEFLKVPEKEEEHLCEDEKKGDDSMIRPQNLVLNMIIFVLFSSFMRNDQFLSQLFNVIERPIRHYENKVESQKFVSKLVKSLLVRIGSARKYLSSTYQSPCWQNLIQLSEFIAWYIFKTPFLCDVYDEFFGKDDSIKFELESKVFGVHINDAFQCTDQPLADSVVSLYKQLHLDDGKKRRTTIVSDEESEKQFSKQISPWVSFYTDTNPYFVLLDNAAQFMNPKELITISADWHNTRYSTDDKRQRLLQNLSLLNAQLSSGPVSAKMKSLQKKQSSSAYTMKNKTKKKKMLKTASSPHHMEDVKEHENSKSKEDQSKSKDIEDS
eukprot:TRINITY_DN3008_c1_g2_i1.p1 TRINITY_DN3008_c1_g2~~TRINITY_DN3008_c1_g2_i1.p1  ORF type:complete len:626 (-),score=147.79 TRINITY_DN3008_c1_g2_i1:37-1869(-)